MRMHKPTCLFQNFHALIRVVIIMLSSRKKSKIWSTYFVVKEDAHLVECNKCKEQISQGGRNYKTFNTMNLVQHLRKHGKEFKKHKKEKDVTVLEESQTMKQLSLEETEDMIRPWNCNDLCAQITCCLVKMVALDSQPFLLSRTVDSYVC